jgi:hypothetical protein
MDLQTKEITVESVKQEITPFKTPNNEEVRVVKLIDTENNKYKFYSHKKDTDEKTKAYLGFTSGKIVKGVKVEIGFNEMDKEFVNKEGKTIKYKDRFIAFFDKLSNIDEAEQPAPAITSETPVEEDISQIPF